MTPQERYEAITEELEIWLQEAEEGDRFPAFREIGAIYGVSTGTVFRALGWAVRHGRLQKKRQDGYLWLRRPGKRWHQSQRAGRKATPSGEALAKPAAPNTLITGFKSIGDPA
jgi:DNA-binding GntR family transcriptional regulator